MDTEDIKKFLNSGAGIAMKDYLLAKLYQLRNIENIKEKDVSSHQAIEVKAQRRAYVKLKEIMQDIMTLSEEVKKKDPRDSFEVGIDD
jgi:hypothetical protein